MSNVHFDAPSSSACNTEDIKEVIAMQGATTIAAVFVEQNCGMWMDTQGMARTEALAALIKEIKAALLS